MNPLLSRLASLRRWTRLVEGWRGLCAVFALVVGLGTVTGLLDFAVHLPGLVRAVVLVGAIAGAGFLAYRYLVLPFGRSCDDLTLALRVEEHYPELNDALASTVQFLQEPETTAGGSVSMRERAISQTLERTEQLDFRRVIDTRGLSLLTVASLLIAATAGYFAYRHEEFARTAFWRLAEPFGRHTWTRVEIHVDNERRAKADDPESALRVARGQPFVLRGRVEGIVPAQAKVEIEGQTHSDRLVPIKRDSEGAGAGGSLVMPLDMTQQVGKFRFRVIANDGTYPARPGSWQEVEVLQPPKLANLNGLPSPQIELHVPAYTDLPSPKKLTPGAGQIEALAGTNVVLRAAADRPLAEAWVEYQPEGPLVTLAAGLSGLGQTHPQTLLSQIIGAQAAAGRVPARFDDEEHTTFSITFMPWMTGRYTLFIQDQFGLPNRFNYELHILPDPLPIITLGRPASSSLTVLPDAEIGFHFRVEDELFAVRSVFVEYRRKGPDGNWIEGGTDRLTLYDGPRFGAAIPYLLARAVPSPAVGPELRLRPRQLELTTRWPLRSRFKEGETVLLQVCADDFCDIYGKREAGRSTEIELHIVGKMELARTINEKVAEVQQNVVRLQKMQENALKAVKEVQGKDKVTQKEIDHVEEAEQIQKELRERVGTRPDEGLRAELAKLQQLLRDNKLTDTEAAEKAGMLKGELDRLAAQELQQIEPQLAEVRKELDRMAAEQKAAGEKKETKGANEKKQAAEKKEANEKGAKDAIDKAAKLQDNAKQSLDELVRAMAPWASMQQIRAEASDIHSKEQALKQELEDLQARNQELEKLKLTPEEKKVNDQLNREEMNRKADMQENLARRMDDLIKMMKDAQAKRAEEKDADSAKRLGDAAKIAEQNLLPKQMRDIAQQMKNQPSPQRKTLQEQEKNLNKLEKVVEALDGKKQDVADRLKDKRKKAEQELDKLAQKMKDLENKMQDANKLQNEQERLQKRQELAKEIQDLKDKMEKQARELARLQEQRAANELNRAAENLDQAAKKLGQNENADEEQKDAQEQVKQAQKDFQESDEELAREQLVKIADKLQGLKERQDAAIERSGEFHKKILAKKFWADELADSLGGDAVAQRGLAKETESLKEKLKQAKVFEHILDRAAGAMEDAAKVMEERKLEGLDARGDPKLAKQMDPEEIENENKRQEETLKYQKQAGRRLEILLDAIKQEIAKKDEEKEKKEQAEQQPQNPDQQPQAKGRPGDGIPPVAQLKVLRAEQLDLNQQTADFAKRHPDQTRLTPDQQKELEQIQKDQGRLMELFQQMMAENKGDQP